MNVYTWGGADTLQWVFEGIKMLTDTNGDMLAVIRLLLKVTTLVVAVEIAFTGKLQPTSRLFAFILIFNVAIVSTTDVVIVDEVNPVDTAAVDDVPSGLAWVAGFSSTMGKWATDGFETMFATFDPNYPFIQFRGHGSLFASRIMQASTEIQVTDPRMMENLSEFAERCIFWGSMVGWFTFSDLAQTGNMWNFLGGGTLGNGLFMRYRDIENNEILVGCVDGYNFIDTQWNAALDHAREVYGLQSFADKTPQDAANALSAALPVAYSALTTIASSQEDIIKQNMMLNTVRRAYSRLGATAGATAIVQDYAVALGEAQQRTTYQTLGAILGRTLPLMRNLIEALIYGIFPIVIFLILVSQKQGETILFYIKTVFWLQLWAPLFALINFLMNIHAERVTTAAANIPGTGSVMNLMTQLGINQVNQDLMAMAGYFVVMIPLLSWSLVSKGGFAASQMASVVGSVASSSGSAAAQEAAHGNISLGNVSAGNTSLGNYSAGNTSMYQQNTAPRMMKHVGSFDSPSGLTTMMTSGGGLYHNALQSDLGLSSVIGSSMSSAMSTKAAQTATAASENARGYMNATSSRLEALSNYVNSTSQAVSSAQMGKTAATASARKAIDDLKSFADKSGMSQRYGSDFAAELALQAGASAGTPLADLVGSQLKAQFLANGKSTESFDKDWQAAQEWAKSSGFKQTFDSAYSGAMEHTAGRTDDTSKGLNESLSGALGRSQQSEASLRASHTEAQQWAQRRDHMVGNEAKFGFNAQNAVRDQLASINGISQNQAGQIFQAANKGDLAAMEQVIAAAKDFALKQGAQLAGIEGPPDRSAVDGKWANDSAEIGGLRRQVESQGVAHQATAEEQAASNNVPSSASVHQNASQTMTSAGAFVEATDAHVNASEGAVEAKGQPTVDNTATAIKYGESPGHVAGAAIDKGLSNAVDFGLAVNQKGSDAAWGLAGKFKDWISGDTPEQTGTNEGQQAEFTDDMPPDLPTPRLTQPTTTPSTRPGGPARVSRDDGEE
jgi:hypothetical protein